jgi:hypothetical protein
MIRTHSANPSVIEEADDGLPVTGERYAAVAVA